MLNYLLIAVFLLYLIVMGAWLSWTSRIRSFQGIPEVSYSWVTMSLPFGAALLLMTTLLKVRAELRGERQQNIAVDPV
jgi:TRAP-type C4-dicarboxylate transport system permease small subunit